MTFRRLWLTALGLSPVVFVVVLMTVDTFPFVADALRLRCTGEGDSFYCPGNANVLGGVVYSAVIVTDVVMIAIMLVVIQITRLDQRPLLARDLHIFTLVVAGIQVVAGMRIGVSLGGLVMLAGVLHFVATAALLRALVKPSRSLAIAACAVEVASLLGPLVSPVLGAAQATTATCFVILLLALVARWAPAAEAPTERTT